MMTPVTERASLAHLFTSRRVGAACAVTGLALMATSLASALYKIATDPLWPANTDNLVYLRAVRNFAAGANPYELLAEDPYGYPPLFIQLLTPLWEITGDGRAWLIWPIITFGSAMAAVIILLRGFGHKLAWGYVLLGCGLIAFGHLTRNEVYHGQANLIVVLLLASGFALILHGKSYSGSLLWALMINIKPFLGLVILFLVWKRYYKAALSTFVQSGAIFVCSFLLMGAGSWEAFVNWRLNAAWYGTLPRVAKFDNQSIYAFLMRLFSETDYSVPLMRSPGLVPVLMLPVVALALAIFVLAVPRTSPLSGSAARSGPTELVQLGLALALALGCGPLYQGDYLYYLLPGLAGALLLWSQDPERRDWLVVTLVWLLALYGLFVPIKLAYLDTYHWSRLQGPTLLYGLHNGLAALVAALATAVALRRDARATTSRSDDPRRAVRRAAAGPV